MLARLGHGLERDQVLVRHDLGADEAARQVSVDRASRVHRVRPVGDRPGSHLIRPRGEERDQTEQPIAEPDDSVQARLRQAQLLHEDGRLVGLELAQLHLDLGRQRVDQRGRVPIASGEPGHDLGLARQVGLADVEQYQDRLLGQEAEATDRLLLIGGEALAAQGPARDQRLVQPLQKRQLAVVGLALRRRSVMSARLQALQALLHDRKVGQRELQIQSLEVAPRVDRTLGVRHGRIIEGPDDVQQCIGLAQSRQLIGRQLLGSDSPFGRGRRRRQVEVRDVGVDDLLGLEDLGQPTEPLVWDLDGPDVQLHSAVAAGLSVASGKRIENRCLPRAR